MTDIATWLSRILGSPVEDRTGITGHFDVKVSGPTMEMLAGSREDPTEFVTAIRRQLALNLRSEKGVTQILTVDNIHRPSQN